MASYAALVSLEATLEKFIRQDQFQILDDEDKRQSFILLMQNVSLLLEFLNEYPGSARQLEKKITHSANEAECLLENYVWEARFNGKVSLFGSSKLFLQINSIARAIESIVREAEGIKSDGIAEDGSTSRDEPLSLPESEIRKKKDKVVGFDNELVRVKDCIFSDDSKMLAISIVGMGGVGKTTLARAAFDDPAVVDYFDILRWVTISQIFDTRAILRAILDEESSDETASVKDLSVKVHQLLYRRRYIIIVDDVWSSDAWDGVKRFIPDDNTGSRVLLTTRDETVASYAGSPGAIHHLGLMDRERSWRLLERRVFGEGACCPPELVKLGETITEGCKGLPLAIVVIAGVLSNAKRTPDSWKRIAEEMNMVLSKGDEFSEILSLSYYHLPHFLKPCFLYFSAFPEDCNIDVSNLIKQWVAEGFLKAKPVKLAEEIAYGCLEDLKKRNLIMVIKKGYNGEIKICRIHDLLRQLCKRQAEEEKFFHHAEDMMKLGISSVGKSQAHRISFSSQVSSRLMNLRQCSVRTALCFQHDKHLISKLVPCRLLRVLDIKAGKSWRFQSKLFELYHLRYLAFTYKRNVDFNLPEAICNLENLETLIAYPRPFYNSSRETVTLPCEFWTMKNLRHVILYRSVVLPDPISQRLPLENLLTLSNLYNFRCKEEVVELIPNVRKIAVFYELDCQRENWYDYNLNNFGRFSKLECMRIELEEARYQLDWCKRNPFMECLVLPPSLRRLRIDGGAARIPWEDMTTTLGSLPNLESLKLWHYVCSGDVWETKEGFFKNLRVLEVCYTDLKCWITESSSHFRNLERLVLRFCDELTELPDCIGDIPTLQLIKVDDHQKVVADWARRIGEEQHDDGNELLNIEVEEVRKLKENYSGLKKDESLSEELGEALERLFVIPDVKSRVNDRWIMIMRMAFRAIIGFRRWKHSSC